jgi:multidrug transporter EmrE-like cation transporter
MNIFNNGITYGLLLAFNDVINMSINKEIVIGNIMAKWLPVICILYGFQMYIFNKGLQITQMSVLNLTWNLFSNIIITIIGIYYFKENITNLESYGVAFAIFSLFLFSLAQYKK